MNESEWTSSITASFRTAGFLAFKLADGYTTSVPDLTVIGSGHTTWMEMKLLRPGQKLYSRVHERETQWLMMCAIWRANSKRAHYVVRMPNNKVFKVNPILFEREETNERYLELATPIPVIDVLIAHARL